MRRDDVVPAGTASDESYLQATTVDLYCAALQVRVCADGDS